MSRHRFRGSVPRSVVLSLVEAAGAVAVAVAAAFTRRRDMEGKLLAPLLFDEMLLLVDGVGDGERSCGQGDGGLQVSSSKMRPSKIAWKSEVGSGTGGIILAFLRTSGSGVADEVKAP